MCGTRADAAHTVWPIASITKTVTAIALLQLVDDGRAFARAGVRV